MAPANKYPLAGAESSMAKTQIWVFDVEHGFCAFVRAPNDATLMIDCGRSDYFSPALYVRNNLLTQAELQRGHPITQLIVTHPHDDHIEDIETIRQYLQPALLHRWHYDWDEVEGESGGDYENLRLYEEFQTKYTLPAAADWGELKITTRGLSVDQAKRLNPSRFINNSSIVTVIEVSGFKMVFPGDIENDGWVELLRQDTELCAGLRGAAIFVTSHHGHSSGYAPEVYDVMGRPYLNLSSIHHGDLNVEKVYSSPDRAIGVDWKRETRYHFTTRRDGSLYLIVNENGTWTFAFTG